MTTQNSNELRAKAEAMTNAWQSAESAQQHHHCARMQTPKELCGTTALVMLLSPVAAKAAHETLIAEPTAKKSTRVTFMVLRVLEAGWSKSPATAEAAAAAISAGKNGVNKGPTVSLAEKFGADHCALYSYQMLKRGLYQKGLRSPESVVVSPGMIFTLKVWTSNVSKVFKEVTEDVQPFQLGVAQVVLRSSECAKSDEMMDLKSLTLMHNVSPSALRLVDGTLFPSSLQEAAMMRTRFLDASHLSPEERDTSVLSTLKQEWLKSSFSGTVSAIRVALPLGSGAFAIGPDDLLRFHVEGAPMGGLSCSSLMVQYDPKQFEGAPREWVVALLNVGLMLDDRAVELLISIDTYTGKEGGSAPVVAFARLNILALTGALLTQSKRLGCDDATMSKPIAAAFPDAKQRKHLAVFSFAEGKVHLVMDTRRISRRGDAPKQAMPTLSMAHIESAWQKGYNAHVFVEGRLVFHFVATADSAAASSLSAARGLQTIAMPAIVCQLVGYDDDEIEAEASDETIEAEASEETVEAEETSVEADETVEAPEVEENTKAKKRSASGGGGGGKRGKRHQDDD